MVAASALAKLKQAMKVEAKDSMENNAQKRSRVISLYTVHVTMVVISLGSSIIFTGLYPYLYLLDSRITMLEYGMVVAADATAQMIFSPLFGFIADKMKSVRLVSIICCLLFSSGNALYAMAGVFNRDSLFGTDLEFTRFYVLLVSRFVVGAGTSLNSTGRYYVSLATRLSERTTHIAYLSLFQTIGFIVGPGIQAALTPLGGYNVDVLGEFYFDMYTTAGWVSCTAGVVCLILYLPYIFTETFIAREELEYIKTNSVEEGKGKTKMMIMREMSRISLGPSKAAVKTEKKKELLKSYSRISIVDGGFLSSGALADDSDSESDTSENSGQGNSKWSRFIRKVKSMKYPPIFPTFVLIWNFFSFLSNFVLVETILTPLAMHMFAWTQEDAIFYLGMTMIGGGVCSIVMFAFIGPLAQKFDERILLLFCGIIPMIVGRLIIFPFPGVDTPQRFYDCSNVTTVAPPATASVDLVTPVLSDIESTTTACEVILGCPYDWCDTIPKIEVAQFMVGYMVATAAYPFCLALSGSIYSKILGNIPQGFWLGLLNTSGSLARVVGPLFVTDLYEQYGTYATFGTVTGALGLSLVLTILSYRQLVPRT